MRNNSVIIYQSSSPEPNMLIVNIIVFVVIHVIINKMLFWWIWDYLVWTKCNFDSRHTSNFPDSNSEKKYEIIKFTQLGSVVRYPKENKIFSKITLPIQQHVSHSFSRNNSIMIYQFSSPEPNNTLVHKILLIVKYHSFCCHSRDYKQMCCFDEYGIIWFKLSAILIQDIQIIFRIQIIF